MNMQVGGEGDLETKVKVGQGLKVPHSPSLRS